MATTELYKWTGATPDDALVHGRFYIDGALTGQVSFRRGVDISFAFDTKGAMAGSMGDGPVAASLTAEFDAHAALQIQAQLPLDFFAPPGAGLVARFRAGGDVSASVALTATLDFGELIEKLTPGFSGPWASLLDLVLDELDVSVGIWGHVEAAAEIQGQALLAGSVLPSDDPAQQPGFCAQFSFRAGFLYGTGLSIVANIGLLKPDRLVARLGERLADLTTREITHSAATLQDAGARDAAEAGAALARLFVPLGLESAYRVGAAVVADGDRRDSAVTAIGDQLVHQAQAVVLRAVTQYAAKELGRLFDPSLVVDAMLVLDDPSVVLGPFRDVETAALQLAKCDSITPDPVLTAIEALLGAAESLLATPLFVPSRVTSVRRTLAILWSAAQLMQAVVTVASTPSTVNPAAFKATAAPLPGAAAFAEQIPHAGADPTLAELVAFLAGDIYDEVLANIPWLSHVVNWSNQALAKGASLRLLETLFGDFLPPEKARIDQIISDLAPVVSSATSSLRTDALAPLLAATTDPVLREMLEDVVDPLFDVLPGVALAGLEQLNASEDAAQRVREALAVITFQAVGKFVLDITTQLADDALTRQAAGLNASADDIHRNGTSSATYHSLSQLGLGGILTVPEAEELLRISANALSSSDVSLHRALSMVSGDSGAGIADPAQRTARLAQLLRDDSAPTGVDLGGDLGNLSKAAIDLAGAVIPPFAEFAARWGERRIGDLANEAGQAAGQVIVWVKGRLADLRADIQTLEQQIGTWEQTIESELGALATEVGAIDDALRAEADAVINDLEARGDSLIDQIVPDVRDWRATAKRILHGLLAEAQSVVDSVLGLLKDAADAAAEALYAAAGTGQVSSQTVHDHVRSTVFARSHLDLSFGLSIFGVTFPLTVTSGDVAGAAWARASASAAYSAAVDRGVSHAQAAAQAQAQKANLQAVHDQAVTAEQAYAAADDLVPGQPLSIAIETPSDGSAAPGRARLQLRIKGANRTFVEPTLGIAQRVIVRINDVALEHFGPWWWVDGPDLIMAAQLVPMDDQPSSHGLSLTVAPRRRLIETVSLTEPPDGLPIIERFRPENADGQLRATPRRPPDAAGSDAQRLMPRDGGNLDVVDEPQRPKPTVHQTTPVSTTEPPRGGTVVVTWPTTKLWIPPLDSLPQLPARYGVNTLQVAVYDGAGRTATATATFGLLEPDQNVRRQIAYRAYFKWVARGRQPGHALDDWLQAQAEVLHPMIAELAYRYGSERGGGPGRELEDWLRAEQAVILHELGQ